MSLILLLFLLATFVQLLYWLFVFSQAWANKQSPAPAAEGAPVSIIICARNEAENLRQHLPAILEQSVFLHSRRSALVRTGSALSLANSELLIVDDGSTDGTAAVVRSFQANYPYLRLIQTLQPTRPGKKDALSLGIASAKHQYLLLTDADCRPASTTWAALMSAPLFSGAEVVLGYSPYQIDNSWLGRWQAFETDYTALQYLGFAQIGQPYMGVGRNLAYHKSFFERAGGFEGHAQLPGGDDDLLISQNASGKSTEVQIQNNAWTWSKPAQSWKEYWLRKRRHLSVGNHYPATIKWRLGGLALSHGLHYLLALLLLINGYWAITISTYLVRALVILLVWSYRKNTGSTTKASPSSIERSRLYVDYLLCDAALCFYYLFNIWATLLAPSTKRWS